MNNINPCKYASSYNLIIKRSTLDPDGKNYRPMKFRNSETLTSRYHHPKYGLESHIKDIYSKFFSSSLVLDKNRDQRCYKETSKKVNSIGAVRQAK